MGGKKRKYEYSDPNEEKLLYAHFQHAANSISHLYSSSIQQQRRVAGQASRGVLERLLQQLLKDYGGVEHVPKAALLQMLQQEYENVEGSEQFAHSVPGLFSHTGPVQEPPVCPLDPHAFGHKRHHAATAGHHTHQHHASPLSSASPLSARRMGGGALGVGNHLHGVLSNALHASNLSSLPMEVAMDHEQQQQQQQQMGGMGGGMQQHQQQQQQQQWEMGGGFVPGFGS